MAPRIARLADDERDAAVALWHAVAAAEAWVAERGIGTLELIRADNAAAREFYAALGYGREDVTVMSRRLG